MLPALSLMAGGSADGEETIAITAEKESPIDRQCEHHVGRSTKMSMTKEDWAEVERKATSYFSSAHLMIDGYKITLRLVNVGKLRMAIMVYVNDRFNGSWIQNQLEGQELCRRFFFRKTTHWMSLSKLKKCGYRGQRLRDEYKKCEVGSHTPLWDSWSRLKAHLIRENKEISVFQPETAAKV
jgi:hypothetical protein